MLDALRSFIARKISPPVPVDATSTGPDADLGVRVAVCALLLELAHADGEFSPTERQHVENLVRRHFGLDDATAGELIKLAEMERGQSVDHFRFTRLITAQYDIGQRMVLAEAMWGVILADGQIAGHETYLVRRLANLLELEPAFLAQARRAAGG